MICVLLLLFLLSFGVLVFQTGIMSAFLIFAAFIVSLFGCIILIKRQQYISFLFVGAFLSMYFANPFLVSLGVFPLESSTSLSMYALSNFLLIVGLGLFFWGTTFTRSKALSAPSLRIYFDRKRITAILRILFLFAFAGLCIVFVFGGGFSLFQATRAELAAQQMTFAGMIRLICIYMFFPLLVAAPLLITQMSKPLQVVPWIILGVLLIVHFLVFRARTQFVTVLASTAISVLLKNRIIFVYGQSAHIVFRTIRDYFAIAILLMGIFVGGIVITFVRGAIGVGRIELGHEFLRVWLEKSFDGGDFGYQKIQRAAYSLFPSQHPFLLGQTYYRILLIPIPRFIMPNKPLNEQRVFCSVIDPVMYETGGTIPAGILGDLYVNFGHFGIVGMFLYGMLLGRERYYRLWHWLMLAGSMTWLFHFVRGAFTNPLVTFFVYMFIAIIVERILAPDYTAEDYETPGELSYAEQGVDSEDMIA